MFHSRTTLAVIATLFAGGMSGSVAAQESGAFDLSILGIRVGVLAYEATVTDDRYEARGSAKATGLVGAFFDGAANAVSTGRVDGNALKPSTFKDEADTKKGIVERTFVYRNGIPEITRNPPRKKPQKYAAPANEQAGTVDPMTAAFAILRDRPASEVCKMDISMYDGNRRSRLTMTSRSGSGDEITCTGIYQRVAGFSPKEMAERSSWPVSLVYDRAEKGRYQVALAEFTTDFGTARLTRR